MDKMDYKFENYNLILFNLFIISLTMQSTNQNSSGDQGQPRPATER